MTGLTEEERTRIQMAKRDGGVCARCGRELVEGEAVWIERFDVNINGAAYWWAPVGAECVAPETVRATCGMEPERCVGCGREIFNQSMPGRRRFSCSRRCARRARLSHHEVSAAS